MSHLYEQKHQRFSLIYQFNTDFVAPASGSNFHYPQFTYAHYSQVSPLTTPSMCIHLVLLLRLQ